MDKILHIYCFYSDIVYISVKATSLADAIDELRCTFGESWVEYNIDSLEINRFKPQKK